MLLKGAVKVIFLLLVERNETADSDTILDVQIILFTSVLFIKWSHNDSINYVVESTVLPISKKKEEEYSWSMLDNCRNKT